ncbi:tyrosine--tRNA ligase [Jatrophihabitans telluris]|uniref:Tyrosine--tRNA ligase n=1 Tax=Jatrophihabitans telluris TaxID=2038343 RepID=A0ABY4R2U1_9ACTN|nr:tyrosine--tRNA ligase [Jatrophihabitans telluris]UQX90109.1 tyrosine--tRNA ligase [Jatrophihabitans telluris]
MSTDPLNRTTAIDALPSELRPTYEILAAGAADILPADGLAERMLAARVEQRPLRVKLGIDPSGAELTLGHAVVLRKLRQFQDVGHVAVLVVGGFTGQVGDPSGKTATRLAQSAEQVIANAKGYFDQVMQILDPERTEVVNNDDWLGRMDLSTMLDYTRQVTVAQLLERDDFARRFAAKSPISLSEFFYPLLQGIDSVEIRADIELGGTDQTFNNLVGRALQRSRGQAPQAVLTVPLLVGTDGVEKMGKSLGNFVAIAEPAPEQFGKLMSIPDTAVATYAVLASDLLPDEVARVEQDVIGGGAAANRAKRLVARRIVALYHGTEAAQAAEAQFDRVHKEGDLATQAVQVHWDLSGTVHLPALLAGIGLTESTSAARRFIDAGSVRIDGVTVPAKTYDIPGDQLDGRLVAIGKRKVARVTNSIV